MTALVAAAPLPDQRDGQVYRAVIIGQARWCAQNLNYETPDSRCHGDRPAHCTVHGRLYQWNEAMTACPPGRHLPSDRDWKDLEIAIGMKEADAGLERGGAYVRLGERAAF